MSNTPRTDSALLESEPDWNECERSCFGPLLKVSRDLELEVTDLRAKLEALSELATLIKLK
jgi:hypothetical protein